MIMINNHHISLEEVDSIVALFWTLDRLNLSPDQPFGKADGGILLSSSMVQRLPSMLGRI